MLALSQGRTAHAGDLVYSDWAVSSEVVSRSYPYTNFAGIPVLYDNGGTAASSASGLPFADTSTNLAAAAQGSGLLTASSVTPLQNGYYPIFKTSWAKYGENVVIRLTVTRLGTSSSEKPKSLHIQSNCLASINVPGFMLANNPTEGAYFAEWKVDVGGSSVISGSKYRVLQSPNAIIASGGTGNGNVYLAPTSSSGTPGQIGEKLIWELTLSNKANIETPRVSPYSGGGTVVCNVIGQYAFTPSQFAPQGFTAIPL
jgi:hypothetical protein